ncbi:phosphatidylserine decarboxylase [Colletotrichum tofieldiae]|nr:phosphatidylserine decarboxylase [Colletotrichum tofieldiae]
MVRIIPGRLKSSSSLRNSRSSSPTRNSSNGSSTTSKMGEPSPKENGLTLKVVIMKARNLAAKDRSGTSDPYLVLTLGDAKVTTHEVPKTLNPEWNVIEELPVNTTQCLLLDVICWDKDRFGKDYLGEFDLALEEIFADEQNEQPPKWYPLRSKRPGKKTSVVSGEVMLQFTLFDQSNTTATREQIFEKFYALVSQLPAGSRQITPTMTPLIQPVQNMRVRSGTTPSPPLSRNQTDADQDEEDDDDLDLEDDTPEDEDPSKPEVAEKRRRRLRIKGLKKKKRDQAYEFNNSGSDVVGIIYLEVLNITDLPPSPIRPD